MEYKRVTVLTKDDTQAIKTDNKSACNVKLKPSGNCRFHTIERLSIIGLINNKVAINVSSPKVKAMQFLIFTETFPAIGTVKLPNTGTATEAISVLVRKFINYPLYDILF